MGYLRDSLQLGEVLRELDPPEGVRSFLEGVLESFPDLDIHLLAMVRRRETSEEGREALTGVMRGLL